GVAQAAGRMPASSMSRAVRALADMVGTFAGAARRGGRRLHPEVAPAGGNEAEAARLRDAFHAFEGAAHRLESSYALLRNRVEELTAQLAHANGALERELAEKQALAERQAALLSALPAG